MVHFVVEAPCDYCPYCGKHGLETVASDKTVAVAMPFSVSHDEAMTQFRDWMGGRMSAPFGFGPGALPPSGAQKIYIPFWEIAGTLEIEYTGLRTDYDGSTPRQSHVSGPAQLSVAKLLCASKDPWIQRNNQGPSSMFWGTGNAVALQDARDVVVECSQLDVMDAFDLGRDEVKQEVGEHVIELVGGDKAEVTCTHELNLRECRQVLVPAWWIRYRFQGRAYKLLVSGENPDDVRGEHPLSKMKIGVGIAAVVVGAGAVIWMLA